jgi:hypothetical protein
MDMIGSILSPAKGKALMSFIYNAGIPQLLISDNSGEQTFADFGDTCTKYHINGKYTVPHSPWATLAEASIRKIKVGIHKVMQCRKSLRRTWCYCGEWVAAIRRLTALNISQLEGRVPEEAVTGYTPDISPYTQFDWYEYYHVWYHDPVPQFPFEKKLLGRWLGVAESSTDIMAFYILTKTSKVIIRKSTWGLSMEEMQTPAVQLQVAGLNLVISQKIGDAIADDILDPDLAANYPDPPPDEIFGGDEALDEPEYPDATHVDADNYKPELYDEYLLAEILLPCDGELKTARVCNWVKDANRKSVGKRNANPLLDTREYKVEFPDGSIDALQVNIIAENMFSQINNEG